MKPITTEDLAPLDQNSLRRIREVINEYHHTRNFIESLIAKRPDKSREQALKEILLSFHGLNTYIHAPDWITRNIAMQMLKMVREEQK